MNTLSQKYEMFKMQPRESTVALQKRFVHLTNHFIALGKTFTNNDLNLKVLRSLTKEWQPKVTAISEKKNLSTMTSASLFGKIQERELEIVKIERHENQEKKQKGISLKVDSVDEAKVDVLEEDENFMCLVKKSGNYFGNNNMSNFLKKKKIFNKKETSSPTQIVTCYECRKQGNNKTNCLKLSKKSKHKGRKESKSRRAYMA